MRRKTNGGRHYTVMLKNIKKWVKKSNTHTHVDQTEETNLDCLRFLFPHAQQDVLRNKKRKAKKEKKFESHLYNTDIDDFCL